MGMVEQGEEVDLFVDDHPDNERNALGSGSSTTTRLNNKVILFISSIFSTLTFPETELQVHFAPFHISSAMDAILTLHNVDVFEL